MERFLALLFSGLTDGALAALAAAGLLVLYKATGLINFAHGELITLGGYLGVWLVTDHGWAYLAALPAVMALMVAVGVAMERTVVVPLRGRSVLVVVIATLGAGLALRSLIAIWQGTDPRRLSSPLTDDSTEIFGALLSHHRLAVIGVAFVVLVAIVVMFHRTRYGRELRALATDRAMARLVGVRAGVLSMGAFGLSAMLAGLAGYLVAPLVSVDVTLGFGLMLNAFVAMIIGGFGSVSGVMLAAVGIGLIERVVGGYFAPDYSNALPFLVMIAAIAIRPEGIFGAREHAARL